MPDCGIFDLKLECAKHSLIQGNVILNQCVIRDRVTALNFNVKNEYPRVQPDYENAMGPEYIAQPNYDNSKLLRETNSIENENLRHILWDYFDIFSKNK